MQTYTNIYNHIHSQVLAMSGLVFAFGCNTNGQCGMYVYVYVYVYTCVVYVYVSMPMSMTMSMSVYMYTPPLDYLFTTLVRIVPTVFFISTFRRSLSNCAELSS